jgi:hypothetical protein
MAVVCQSVASLRSSPSPRSELLTQEVFGRTVSVESVSGEWAKCVLGDGYRGWMFARALDQGRAQAPTHFVVRRFAHLSTGGGCDLLLPMGSLVAVRTEEDEESRVDLPDGRPGYVQSACLCPLDALPWGFDRFPKVQREVEGTPYLWGGKSTFGFDCSGLVQMVFEFFGFRLPRDSKDQSAVGKPVGSLRDARPFDLLFFGDGDLVDHVGIHLGDLSILHASGNVKVESLSESSHLFRQDLLGRFKFAKRIERV